MAKGNTALAASQKAIDPNLAALFASSSGPAATPPKSRYSALIPRIPVVIPNAESGSEEEDVSEESSAEDEKSQGEEEEESESDNSEAGELSDDNSALLSDGHEAMSEEGEEAAPASIQRKRKRGGEDDLETRYFDKLAHEAATSEPAGKKRKGESSDPKAIVEPASNVSESSEDDSDDDVPVHESISKDQDDLDLSKDEAGRTVYLANISTEAVKSKGAEKTLRNHLKSVLDKEATPQQKLEKLRFRSLPVSSTKLPKRAAFITKSLMDATTKACQAYAVYSTPAAARVAATKINGTVVLQRHVRADIIAHPAEQDHRRCVFVGNLNLVDDETVMTANSEGETAGKKKPKVPSDVEEGLWQIFGQKAGKVEFVRVPRDPKTRVGKGFAYVQFVDPNSVEKALLLDEQKFPPMLPRKLRVARCKDPRKTARAAERNKAKLVTQPVKIGRAKDTNYNPKATPAQQSDAGRAAKLFGKGGAARLRHGGVEKANGRRGKSQAGEATGAGEIKAPETIVFEGRRATAKDGKPAGMKFGAKSKGKADKGKLKNRSSRRAAEWRKSASKK